MSTPLRSTSAADPTGPARPTTDAAPAASAGSAEIREGGYTLSVSASERGSPQSGPPPGAASGPSVGPPDVPSDAAAGDAAGEGRPGAFEVRLSNFEGPFDLLLTLISKHQLDVTEVALSQVTDEFIAYIRALGSSWDLGQATEFLVVAATLLDLKAARLLPSAEVEDEEDLALLEARDLLFARLLQYRAYKQAAAHLQDREREQSRRFPRAVALEPRFAELMPELLLTISPEQLARIAADALRPKPPPVVSIAHVHAPRVSVREHAMILRERLARTGRSTFRALTHDCEHTVEIVARFLALLELYREGAVAFDQVAALGELWVRWTGAVGPEEPAEDENMDEEYG
jgi:segregation and condensation protein A